MRILCGTILAVAAFSASGATGQSVVVDVQSPAKAELIADVGVLRSDFGRDAFGWAEIGWGTDPAQRAFYRAFRELCLAACPAERLFLGGR